MKLIFCLIVVASSAPAFADSCISFYAKSCEHKIVSFTPPEFVAAQCAVPFCDDPGADETTLRYKVMETVTDTASYQYGCTAEVGDTLFLSFEDARSTLAGYLATRSPTTSDVN